MNQSQPVQLNREWIANQFDTKLTNALGRKRMLVSIRPNLNATDIQKYQDLYQKFLDLYPNEKSKLDSAGLPADPNVKP